MHVLLPNSGVRTNGREFNPYLYADTGLRAFLKALTRMGADKSRLQARLAGGGDLVPLSNLLNIGRKNSDEAVGIIRAEGIPILGSSLGGSAPRSMSLRIKDGVVTVRLIGRGQEIL
ncbi:MAG: chemotaxis protein CheD [Deltaproteobacteria bacterium]|nr:chemotaxis protein CheD [Deltaproteobacteria bacterium]